jgi:hypothetical protein
MLLAPTIENIELDDEFDAPDVFAASGGLVGVNRNRR